MILEISLAIEILCERAQHASSPPTDTSEKFYRSRAVRAIQNIRMKWCLLLIVYAHRKVVTSSLQHSKCGGIFAISFQTWPRNRHQFTMVALVAQPTDRLSRRCHFTSYESAMRNVHLHKPEVSVNTYRLK